VQTINATAEEKITQYDLILLRTITAPGSSRKNLNLIASRKKLAKMNKDF